MAPPEFVSMKPCPPVPAFKERPILFSAPMVRALLDGTKTQTRRVCKSQPYVNGFQFDGHDILCHNDYLPPSAMLMDVKRGPHRYTASDAEGWEVECPHGQAGDRLWVRESVAYDPEWGHKWADGKYLCEVFGDAYSEDDKLPDRGIPSIHVPRRYSRIDLEITGVRVERLQDISAEDAQAEGITFTDYGRKCGHGGNGWTEIGSCPAAVDTHPQRPGWGVQPTSHAQCMHSAPAAFASLWSQINGAASWAANPWVWVVEFRRIQPC